MDVMVESDFEISAQDGFPENYDVIKNVLRITGLLSRESIDHRWESTGLQWFPIRKGQQYS